MKKTVPPPAASPTRNIVAFVLIGSLLVVVGSFFMRGAFHSEPPRGAVLFGFVVVGILLVLVADAACKLLKPRWSPATRHAYAGLIVTAVVGAGSWQIWYSKPEGVPQPTLHVLLNEGQKICGRGIKAFSSDKQWTFESGVMQFETPALDMMVKLYDAATNEFLGTLTLPHSHKMSPVQIDLEKSTALWKLPVREEIKR